MALPFGNSGTNRGRPDETVPRFAGRANETVV
jgi:hypothetical protein